MSQPTTLFACARRLGALALAGAGVGAAALLGSSSVAASAVAAGPPSCRTAGLVVWLDTTPNGAAGSQIYTLEFTNQSGHTCTLRGYPGVSAINLKGRRVGRAAFRDHGFRTRTITLRDGGTARAPVRIAAAGNFPPSSCGPTSAAGLRVYPPNQRASKTVPLPFAMCSRGPSNLDVQPVRHRKAATACWCAPPSTISQAQADEW